MKNKQLSQLSDRILDVALLIETLRDASLGLDNSAHAHVLDNALNEQLDIYDELESICL